MAVSKEKRIHLLGSCCTIGYSWCTNAFSVIVTEHLRLGHLYNIESYSPLRIGKSRNTALTI